MRGLTLFTSRRPCRARVPVLTVCTQDLFGRCVCLRVFTVAQSIGAVQQTVFKGPLWAPEGLIIFRFSHTFLERFFDVRR